MEDKLVSHKNVIHLFAFALILLGNEALGCSDIGDDCHLFKGCCAGGVCSRPFHGGICLGRNEALKVDECRKIGEECSFRHRCCRGNRCSLPLIIGGTCIEKDTGCLLGREKGVECGMLVPAMCCGRLRCSSPFRGVCEKPIPEHDEHDD